uniref:Uncharacterized protein n=1 Tax=Acrobeloides nanus TaxID=290746 RepID=A0A914DA04_9BILA
MKQSKPVLLSSKETYEIYEKRSVSPYRQPAYSPSGYHTTLPATAFPPPPPLRTISSPNPYKPQASHSPSVHFDDLEKNRSIITRFLPSNEAKTIPIGWIIGIAVAVPIFVILVLFIAVWLQELGIL